MGESTITSAWQRDLPLEPPAERRTLHGPVIFDNEWVVGAEDWALSFPDGQVYDLNMANGTIVGSSAAGATTALAVADGRLVREVISGGTGQYTVSLGGWDFRPVLPAGPGFDPPGPWAIVGGNVACSARPMAGWRPSRPPAAAPPPVRRRGRRRSASPARPVHR